MKRVYQFLCAVFYTLTGLIWLHNGLRDWEGFFFVVALVWLIGGVIWILRFFKEKNDPRKEN